MKELRTMTAIVLLLAAALSSAGGELSEELALFEPLVGQNWLGHYSDAETAHFDHCIEWQLILDGAAVREVKHVLELDFAMETFFYWNQESGKVEFVRQTNRQQLSTGTVQLEDETIVLLGTNHYDDRRYRATYDVTDAGTLEDRFELVDPVEGARGHLIVYEPFEDDARTSVTDEERADAP